MFSFMSSNEDLQLMKITWDPHMNRIYFHLANRFNHEVTLDDFNLPEYVIYYRCGASDTFFCGDPRYTPKHVNMYNTRKGPHYTRTELAPFEIFEQNRKSWAQIEELSKERSPNTIPPFTFFSVFIEFPVEPAHKNHFIAPEREFYKSERRYRNNSANYLSCISLIWLSIFMVGLYFSTVFLVYALYKRFYEEDE